MITKPLDWVCLLIVGIVIISSCKKEEIKAIPELTTSAVTEVSYSSAVSGGNIIANGNKIITKGVCWGTTTVPTTKDSKTIDGIGSENFTSQITGLSNNTSYYVRAYAINKSGTGYGNVVSFKTLLITTPFISTTSVSEITPTTAKSGGNISSDGGSDITSRGVCWSLTQNPTIESSKTTNGAGSGEYTSSITGLSTNTTYFVRAYATNSIGTSYGSQVSFTTFGPPIVTTTAVSAITLTTARSGGYVTSDGGATITARGVCWSPSANPTVALTTKTVDGASTGTFISNITGLSANTTYYYRAYATNSNGTNYGNELSFKTYDIPTVTTNDVTNITATTATSGGTITSDGGSAITAKGVCWSTNQNPTTADNKTNNGTGSNAYTSNISGFAHGTTYYLRAYATNTFGTSYGIQKQFTTVTLYAPTLTTTDVTNITYNSASSGGNITSDGGSAVTARGVCWSINQNPTIIDNKTTNGTGIGNFLSSIANLTHGTTYYVRAYATNAINTSYGEQRTFSTVTLYAPTVTTSDVTGIRFNSATCGGNVTADGGSPVTGKGICWSINQNPTISDNKTSDGTGVGSFTSSISNLSQGTIYFVRAYATTSFGTNYGEERTFTTLTLYPPTVITADITNISYTTATCGGTVTSDGNGDVTARGVCWSTSQSPTIANTHSSNGTGTGTFICDLTNLINGTTYYVRAFVTTAYGTSYGGEKTFSTDPFTIPALSTSSISNITDISAVSGGSITSDGGTAIIAKGICWSTNHNPSLIDNFSTNGTGTGTFTSNMSNLTQLTTYYVRAYATNSIGTNYGDEVAFITLKTYWIKVSDFGGSARFYASGFSIGNKGYIGLGISGTTTTIILNDFWEYDLSTNGWSQKADFLGSPRGAAVAFSIGNKGYIGTGAVGNGVNVKDFWEYDPTTNIWTQKADFGGIARQCAVGFSINNKGYVGTGIDGSNRKIDFWEYDPTTNSWIQKADFPGSARYQAVGFSIDDKGYIGTGNGSTSKLDDFWQYDPSMNIWTQKSSFAGTARYSAVGFSIGSKGYIGAGTDNVNNIKDYWEFDPITNSWTQMADFIGNLNSLTNASVFVIDKKAFIGTGRSGSGLTKEFWSFEP